MQVHGAALCTAMPDNIRRTVIDTAASVSRLLKPLFSPLGMLAERALYVLRRV